MAKPVEKNSQPGTDKELRDKPLGLRIRGSLKDALQNFADVDRRSLAAYCELVLEEHVKARKAGAKRK